MRNSCFVLIFTLGCLWGCLPPADETSTGETAQAVGNTGGKCPPHICGMNAADLSDGFFHELNLDGLANDEGYSLVNVTHDGNRYDLDVVNGRFRATLTLGIVGAPMTLTGTALAGTRLRLRRVVDGTTSYRTLTIQSVARTTDFWAKRVDGEPTPAIETYRFHVGTDSGYGAYLCQNGAGFVDPSSPVRAMPEHHGLVFEGERIDVEALSIAPVTNSRWFNFGCAETALAKLHLTGHTRAAQAAGFSNSILERQTMLKMLTADYCGTGNSFTAAGQPLRWTDDDQTMTIPSSVTRVLEARWTPYGAACLNTPRVLAHPTDASRELFPNVEMQIQDECQRPPTCGPWSTSYHLLSWNRTPFTN